MQKLAVILGAGGQLGGMMTSHFGDLHEVAAYAREQLDITSAEEIHAEISSICPDVIINCAAYTHVDAAEQHPSLALAVNAWGVRALARVAAEIDATLVHFSTDFVFDGLTDRPYVEEDAPNPRSTYGMSKLLGEWFAAEAPHHYVLRVESLFGGFDARSSIDKIFDAIRAGREVRAFADRAVSPAYVNDVVRATAQLLERGAPFGLYHCVNSGWTNWAALAREIARVAGRPDAAILDVAMADAGLIAARPQFAALSNAKLVRAGVAMPTWQEAVERYLRWRADGIR